MKASLLCGLAAVALLAACDKPAEQPASVPVAPATEANLPPDAARATKAWSASSVGVGPLTATTPFTREAIATLFPRSDVKSAYLSEEGAQVPIITVTGPESLVLEIKEAGSTRLVGTTLVQGGAVVGPRGEALLDPWKGMGFGEADCVLGADRFSGAAICRRPDAPALGYVFGVRGDLNGKPGEAPDTAVLADKGFLREFLWQTPNS